MNPVKFPGCNVVYGKDQENYIALPANFSTKTGMAITQWEFTDDEVAEIVRNKRMFIGISTFGKPLQPILPTVMQIFHPGEEPALPEEVTDVKGNVIEVEEGSIKLCADCVDREACIQAVKCKNEA